MRCALKRYAAFRTRFGRDFGRVMCWLGCGAYNPGFLEIFIDDERVKKILDLEIFIRYSTANTKDQGITSEFRTLNFKIWMPAREKCLWGNEFMTSEWDSRWNGTVDWSMNCVQKSNPLSQQKIFPCTGVVDPVPLSCAAVDSPLIAYLIRELFWFSFRWYLLPFNISMFVKGESDV